MGFHARLPPSAAHRWIHCAGSAQASAEAGSRPPSVYADDGTAAHALFEMCNRLDAEPSVFLKSKLHKEIRISGEMVEAVGHALDWVRAYMRRNRKAKLLIEQRVPSGALIGLDDKKLSGEPDVGIYNGAKECIVLDYKHGAGVSVEAKENPQLMLYHAGMRAMHRTAYAPPQRHINVVVQPRSRHEEGPVREWEFSDKYLMNWMYKTVAPAARAALRKGAPRKAGAWCKFCPAAGNCRTQTEYIFNLARVEFKL